MLDFHLICRCVFEYLTLFPSPPELRLKFGGCSLVTYINGIICDLTPVAHISSQLVWPCFLKLTETCSCKISNLKESQQMVLW